MILGVVMVLRFGSLPAVQPCILICHKETYIILEQSTTVNCGLDANSISSGPSSDVVLSRTYESGCVSRPITVRSKCSRF